MDNILIAKILKFGVVGFISFFVDFGVLYFCKEKLLLNKYVANTIAFLIAVAVNFSLNRIWTFGSHDQEMGWQIVKFLCSMTIGLLIGNTIIWILNDKIQFDFAAFINTKKISAEKINFYSSKLTAVIVAMFWNFTINNLIIFAK